MPGVEGEIWIEHWHRYHFAGRWCEGRVVLDVACGEGYGSALLARTAKGVIGVDISAEAIAHARKAYGGLANLRFECAPCTALPLSAESVDVAVTFETVEHIAEQEQFLDELARVLRPGGVLVLSCPNRHEYRDRRNFENPFHVKELYRDELASLVAKRFAHSVWFGQRPSFFSVIAPESARAPGGELFEVAEADPSEAASKLDHPLYFMIAASLEAEALARVPAVVSVLSDRDEWVYRDYEKVMKDSRHHAERGDVLRRDLTDRERSIAMLQEEVKSLQHAREELRETLEGRRGWRWWLRLPFVRLGVLKE